MSKRKLTAKELRATLWETLKAVEAEEIDVRTANAIAGQSREILKSVKLELDIARFKSKNKGFKADF